MSIKFILAVFISIIVFPDGIIKDAYNTPINFWATDNHLISIILCGIIYSYVLQLEDLHNMKKYKKRFINIIIISILTILIVWSGTALVSLSIFCICYLYGRYFDRRGKIINIKNLFITSIVLNLSIVVFRIQYLFEGFITGILHKDITFTNRTILWDNALDLIKNNLLFGLGNPKSNGVEGWLTMSYWSDMDMKLIDTYFIAHNQFLEILINGGLISFIPFLIAMIYVVKRVSTHRVKLISKFLATIIFSYLIVMMTETVYPYPPFYLVLVLAANSHLLIAKRKFENKENM